MRHSESGVTLIELLIVVVISALLTAAIYATFVSQQKSYAIQTGVSDMQQNARAALTLMERDLRMAGFLVGDSGFTVQDFEGNNVTNAITVVDNTGQPDQITVVFAAQQVSTVTNVVNNTVTLDTGGGSQFNDTNRRYIAFETVRGIYTINAGGVSGDQLTLTGAPPAHLAGIGTNGAWAYLVRAITYQVDTTANTLERVASDQIGTAPDTDDLWDDIGNYITDLQLVYPFSGDNQLLQVTLTSSYTDHEGVLRTRQHQIILNIRNNGL